MASMQFGADNILIADDHPLFRSALKHAVLQSMPRCRIVEADSLSGMQDALEREREVDLILMDLHMPGANGYSGLVFVAKHYPDTPVIMISANEDHSIMRQAVDQGAAGFIPKSSSTETIARAISEVLAGNTWLPADVSSEQTENDQGELLKRVGELTPQQFRVLRMVADGMLNKQIAYELSVSEATVKAHVTAIMRKLGVRTRTQAVLALGNIDIAPPA